MPTTPPRTTDPSDVPRLLDITTLAEHPASTHGTSVGS